MSSEFFAEINSECMLRRFIPPPQYTRCNSNVAVNIAAIWLLNAIARTKTVTEYSIKVIAYSCSQISLSTSPRTAQTLNETDKMNQPRRFSSIHTFPTIPIFLILRNKEFSCSYLLIWNFSGLYRNYNFFSLSMMVSIGFSLNIYFFANG